MVKAQCIDATTAEEEAESRREGEAVVWARRRRGAGRLEHFGRRDAEIQHTGRVDETFARAARGRGCGASEADGPERQRARCAEGDDQVGVAARGADSGTVAERVPVDAGGSQGDGDSDTVRVLRRDEYTGGRV